MGVLMCATLHLLLSLGPNNIQQTLNFLPVCHFSLHLPGTEGKLLFVYLTN